MFGVAPIRVPTANFVTFFGDVKGEKQCGNGVFVQGKVLTLAHVFDHAQSLKIGGEIVELAKLDGIKRKPYTCADDALITIPLKRALPGSSKIRLAPEPAGVGDALWGQPVLSGVGHYTTGVVRTRSPTEGSGQYCYTVSTSTQPGSSGSPFFVTEQDKVYLLGLHMGATAGGNVILSVSHSDFH
jgi:hypothetical protein